MDRRCPFCGAHPSLRGLHHRRAPADLRCPRYAKMHTKRKFLSDSSRKIVRLFRENGTHDRCEPLDGADTAEEIQVRAEGLELVGVLLAETELPPEPPNEPSGHTNTADEGGAEK